MPVSGGLEPDPALARLRLLQLHDAGFPVGAFAHSNGLESYAQAGLGPDGLLELLAAQLEFGWGRLDLAALALARRDPSPAALTELGRELDAWKPVPGLRDTSLRVGRRTARLAARLWPDTADLARLERPHQALVAGALARRFGITESDALLAFAHAALAAALAAATRCLPISPERAQELLVELHPVAAAAAVRAAADPRANLWSATPGADLAAHRQPFLRTRLFQS